MLLSYTLSLLRLVSTLAIVLKTQFLQHNICTAKCMTRAQEQNRK